MIRGTKIAFLAAIALTLYWLIASWGVRQGVSAWFALQRRQGWQAEFANLETTGFPLWLRNRITAPVLADPGTGTAWRAEWLELISPAIWPGDLTLAFPSTPQRVSYLDQTVVLQAEALEASLQLAPGLALQLEHLGVSSAAWQLDLDKTPWLEGHALDLEMRQQGDPASYAITAEASGVLPSAVLRQQLAAADGLSQRLDTVDVDMDVQFDTAWDRKALELRRPQPRNIALHLAEARWGPMRIKATGGLAGYPAHGRSRPVAWPSNPRGRRTCATCLCRPRRQSPGSRPAFDIQIGLRCAWASADWPRSAPCPALIGVSGNRPRRDGAPHQGESDRDGTDLIAGPKLYQKVRRPLSRSCATPFGCPVRPSHSAQ